MYVLNWWRVGRCDDYGIRFVVKENAPERYWRLYGEVKGEVGVRQVRAVPVAN